RSLVNANRVPINFQIVDNANTARSCWNFSREIGNHGAFEARRKSHVIDDADPFALRVLRFDVRRNYFDSSLIGGVHRSRSEVVRVTVGDKAKREAWIPFTEVQLNPV